MNTRNHLTHVPIWILQPFATETPGGVRQKAGSLTVTKISSYFGGVPVPLSMSPSEIFTDALLLRIPAVSRCVLDLHFPGEKFRSQLISSCRIGCKSKYPRLSNCLPKVSMETDILVCWWILNRSVYGAALKKVYLHQRQNSGFPATQILPWFQNYIL